MCNSSAPLFSLSEIWDMFPFVFRINDNSPGQTTLTILEEVCKERGWREFGDEYKSERGIWSWNLWWKSVMNNQTTNSYYSWQYINHIPKAINFCNKEYLASFSRMMKSRFGPVFDFCPLTFTLPQDEEELKAEHARRSDTIFMEEIQPSAQNLVHPHQSKSKSQHSPEFGDHSNFPAETQEESKETLSPIWICKPAKKSQGKGIFLLNDLTNIPEHPVTVVQEYIARPLLISGYKFDLRLYVSIVSLSPLTIYVYREGLTRFATEQYDFLDLQNICSHLTNASLNKLSPGYEVDKTVVGLGCKWTLRRLREYLGGSAGLTDWGMWQRVMSIIVLTILGEVGEQQQQQSQYRGSSSRNNFEFLGYDVIIDSNMRPWLLETNLSPGLGGDCPVDEEVKKPMLHEFFTLLGLPDRRSVTPPKIKKTESKIEGSSNKDEDLKSSSDSGEIKTESEKKVEAGKSKQRKKDSICPNLKKRLSDATAIYSQSLKLPLTERRKKKYTNNTKLTAAQLLKSFAQSDGSRMNFLTAAQWLSNTNNSKLDNGRPTTSKSSTELGLQRRCWYDAPIRHGDWIRVFPFDFLSFQMTRGFHMMDMKAIVRNLEEYLEFVDKLVLEFPGESDEFYNGKVKEGLNWNSTLWFPPTS